MPKVVASGKKDEPAPVLTGGGEGQGPAVVAGPVPVGDAERVARVLHEVAQLTDRGSLGAVVQAALGRYRRAVTE